VGDPSHLEVDFSYEAFCLAASQSDCTFDSSDPLYSEVQAELNRIANLYEIQTHQCFGFSTGWSESCLVAYGNQWMIDNKSNKEGLTAHLNELLECTYLGRDQSGECYEKNDEDVKNALVSGSVGQTSEPSAEASEDSASMIPIIAGVVGGVVVLLVIVVIVVMRRKKQGGGSGKKADDRTVVAFENPMYDDPAQQAAQPDYEMAAEHTQEEGLYDEPAFTGTNDKANPMYQSNEALNQGDDAGYLEDVGNEGGGYLDVAPEDE